MTQESKLTTAKRRGGRHRKCWYVMFHLEPQQIERQLRGENESRAGRGLPLFEYFIPYRFLPDASPDLYAANAKEQQLMAEENNDLRKAVKSYVFIKGTLQELERLLQSAWNTQSRLRLFFRRSHEGRTITMTEQHMGQFITICCENRQRFTFGPPLVNIAVHDTVVIKNGTFAGSEAKVLDVQQTDQGISLTLGLPFFCGEKTLKLFDVKPDDLHLPKTVEALLNDSFIAETEEKVLQVLYHRLKGSPPGKDEEPDESVLSQVYHYGYVRMSNSPSHIRFLCVMLLCAVLRIDDAGRKSRAEELESLLTAGAVADGYLTAYMQATLYIATGKADHRLKAKTYWQSHREVYAPLDKLMGLVTRLNASFFRQHKIRQARSILSPTLHYKPKEASLPDVVCRTSGRMVSFVPDGHRQWYALRTAHHHELLTATQLADRGIYVYVALQYKRTMNEGTEVVQYGNILPNTLFAYLSAAEVDTVFHSNGSSASSPPSQAPQVIPDEEMRHFILATFHGDEALQAYAYDPLREANGTRVKVIGGKYKGLCGRLMVTSSGYSHLFVSITNLITIRTPRIRGKDIEKLPHQPRLSP